MITSSILPRRDTELCGFFQYIQWQFEHKLMALLLYCLVFLYQTVLADAECTVTGCNITFCDGNRCTKCIDPFYRNGDSCRHCFLHCRRCDGILCYRCTATSCDYACEIADCPSCRSSLVNVECPNCPDGFYRYGGFCYRCLNTGCKCSSAGDCIDCLPGRYDNSSYCENNCPSECITCTSINYCSKCVPGKYGQACASDCISQCNDGSCDKGSGDCTYECLFNQYWDESDKKCHFCNSRCSSCIYYSQCTSCSQPHYWGSACEKDCVGCSKLCDKDIGCHAGCTSKYYQTQTSSIFECIPCPESCMTCTSPTQCNVCKTGYWGGACQYNCTGCSSACDKSNGCIAGCLAGYFQSLMANGFLKCIGCVDNCQKCLTENDCQKCFDGHFSEDNKTCISCSDTCKNQKCNQFTGSCSDGCVDGYAGEQCETTCPSNCLQCDQHYPETCILCTLGFYGENCKQCSKHCKKNNGGQTCYEGNGTCIYGCEAGYWSTMCTEQCSKRCLDSQCNELMGTCLSGCSVTYYGQLCEQECSPNCVKDSISLRFCKELDGSCQMGCSQGFYGIKCSFECRNCKNMVCFQENGTCEFGCADGFTGLYCTKDTGGNTNNATVVALSVVAGIAVLMAVVLVAGVVILIKRGQLVFIRKKGNASSSECQNQELDNNAYQDLNRTESAEGTYSTVQTDYENSF